MFTIDAKICQEIDRWVTHYPEGQQRSAVIEALLLVQEQNGGWLSQDAMDAVAAYLKLEPIEVYEVATFYDLFSLKPVGKHIIRVCTNVSCHVLGADKIVETLKERLNIGLNETTSDGQFTLQSCECLAACDAAPVSLVNKKMYSCLTPESALKMLEEQE